ncbi:T9SS type A sorting domain-containing protein [Calditrichota bacterium]
MKRLLFLSIVAISLLLTCELSAQENFGMTKIGQVFDYWEDCDDIVVQGDYAFVLTGETGLRIMDISDPRDMIEIGTFVHPATDASRMCYSDSIIYTFSRPIQRIDISNPTEPVLLEEIDIEWLQCLTVTDSLLYLATYNEIVHRTGLRVYSLNSNEVIGHSYFDEIPKRILVEDEIAYILVENNSSDEGVLIFDISDLTNPELLSSIESEDHFGDIDIQANSLYVTDDDVGLKIFDIEDPENPELIGRFIDESVQSPTWVTVSGDLAFLSSQNGLHILDVSDPASIELLSSDIELPYAYAFFGISENALFVSYGNSFWTVDISDPSDTVILQHLVKAPRLDNVAIVNNFLVVLELYYGTAGTSLTSTSPADSAEPKVFDRYFFNDLDTLNLRIRIRDWSVKDDLIFCALDDYGLVIIRIDEDGEFSFEGELKFRSGISQFAFYGELLFARHGNQLVLIDISDPSEPEEITSYEINIERGILSVYNDLLFVKQEQDLIIYNVEDVYELSALSSIGIRGSKQIALEGNRLYVQDHGENEIKVYNISDPSSPYFVGRFIADYEIFMWYEPFDVINGHVIVGFKDIHIIDMTDLANPEIIARYETEFDVRGFAIVSDTLYTAEEKSVGIYDISEALSVSDGNTTPTPLNFHLSAYPNPFNSRVTIDLGDTQPHRVFLTDISGRVVLETEAPPSGVRLLNIDMTAYPSGNYFLSSEAGQQTTVTSITKLK